jgi:hypothetical protein
MKIEFRRSGGHLPVSLLARVDSDQLATSEREALKELVSSARLHELQGTSPSAMPDAFDYRVSVTTDEGEHHEVALSEDMVPSEMRPLLRWLTRRAGPEPY